MLELTTTGKLPLESLDKDKDMEFKVLGEIKGGEEGSDQEKTRQLLLSITQQTPLLQDGEAGEYRPPKFEDISEGSQVFGVVSKIQAENLLIQLSRRLRGSLSIFEVSTDLDKVVELSSLQRHGGKSREGGDSVDELSEDIIPITTEFCRLVLFFSFLFFSVLSCSWGWPCPMM